MSTDQGDSVRDSVKDYYGKTLQKTGDLELKACTVLSEYRMPKFVRSVFSLIHEEVMARYYGCGLVVPEKLEGMRVLDLGSGSGQDCYVVSKLVGESGFVTGIDMTDGQLEIARKHIDYHKEKFGYSKPNIEFVKGYIEKLGEAGIKENSYDIIISNCVINLSPDKEAVLREAYKALKVGGEVFFSDVYADRRVPESARKHEVLWGECISGALWWKDLFDLSAEIGFSKPRLVTAAEIPVEKEEFIKVLGDTRFVSVTYRLFKLPAKDQMKESRMVIYNGELPGYEKEIIFDYKYTFQKGDVVQADEELSTILQVSRFQDEFDYQPVPKKVCNSSDKSSCCPSSSLIEDPFEYLAELKKKGVTPAAPCCAGGEKACG